MKFLGIHSGVGPGGEEYGGDSLCLDFWVKRPSGLPQRTRDQRMGVIFGTRTSRVDGEWGRHGLFGGSE